MDGNGRWAKQKGKPRVFGHQNAVKAVRSATEAAGRLGVKYLTLYAFSAENWNRPKMEIDALMSLLSSTIETEINTLVKNNIRVTKVGNLSLLPEGIQQKVEWAKQQTQHCNGLNLVVALSYGSRIEILNAAKSIAQDACDGKIDLNSL